MIAASHHVHMVDATQDIEGVACNLISQTLCNFYTWLMLGIKHRVGWGVTKIRATCTHGSCYAKHGMGRGAPNFLQLVYMVDATQDIGRGRV